MNGWTFSNNSFSTSFGTTIVIEFGTPLRPPSPPPLPSPLRDACATLGLTPPINGWEVVQKRYRELAKANHPDAGGDPETMKRINAAYTLLKEHRPA